MGESPNHFHGCLFSFPNVENRYLLIASYYIKITYSVLIPFSTQNREWTFYKCSSVLTASAVIGCACSPPRLVLLLPPELVGSVNGG